MKFDGILSVMRAAPGASRGDLLIGIDRAEPADVLRPQVGDDVRVAGVGHDGRKVTHRADRLVEQLDLAGTSNARMARENLLDQRGP